MQLGRRFRALKLWMVLRHFGAEGLRTRLAEHMRLAQTFASWVDGSIRFHASRPGAVQRRVLPPAQDGSDEAQRTPARSRSTRAARCFSRTRGSTAGTSCAWPSATSRTTESHVARAWELLIQAARARACKSRLSRVCPASRLHALQRRGDGRGRPRMEETETAQVVYCGLTWWLLRGVPRRRRRRPTGSSHRSSAWNLGSARRDFGDVGDFEDEFEQRARLRRVARIHGRGGHRLRDRLRLVAELLREHDAGVERLRVRNDSNVTTLMGNLTLGDSDRRAERRRRSGRTRRAASASSGADGRTPTICFDVDTKNDWGFNVGAGIMGFFTRQHRPSRGRPLLPVSFAGQRA